MSKFVRVPKNTAGRDFVCGDIHGCFAKLEEVLAGFNFDRSCDRLFVVGDLVDRGEDSRLCLEYLAEDWFFSIMGNHEQIYCQAFINRGVDYIRWVSNGGGWVELDSPEAGEIYKTLRKLPLAIEIPFDVDHVGLVHAELDCGVTWPELTEELEKIPHDEFDFADYRPWVQQALWGRTRLRQRKSEPVQGIGHLFHGHTILESPISLGNMTFIDVGCFLSNRLACLEINDYLQKFTQ